jgi:hypothetical protein
MTKVELLSILDPEMGIEETLRLAKLSKRALADRIRRSIRAEEATAHSWVTDSLFASLDAPASVKVDPADPLVDPEVISILRENSSARQTNLYALMKHRIGDSAELQALAKMYRDLEAQFAAPKRRRWWQRLWDWFDAYADYNWKLLKYQYEWYRPRKRVVSSFGPAKPGTSRLVESIDVFGPTPGSHCGRCIDPKNCREQGGCCFPPLVPKAQRWTPKEGGDVDAGPGD